MKAPENVILIEEMAPETVIENIVNEIGEEVKQVKTTKKLKKKEGPKEYLIEIKETYEENKPEGDIEITTTELVPESSPDASDDQPVIVLQKIKRRSLLRTI